MNGQIRSGGPGVATGTAEPCRAHEPTGYDVLPALKRRRAASRRMPVLGCGNADPWRYAEPALSDHQLDGWAQAAEHLTAIGCRPIVPVDIARALWRRGDRGLAEHLAVIA